MQDKRKDNVNTVYSSYEIFIFNRPIRKQVMKICLLMSKGRFLPLLRHKARVIGE